MNCSGITALGSLLWDHCSGITALDPQAIPDTIRAHDAYNALLYLNAMAMANELVGFTSVALGSAGLLTAAWPSVSWALRWSPARWIHDRLGRTAMRVFYLLAGLTMLVIGISILRS